MKNAYRNTQRAHLIFIVFAIAGVVAIVAGITSEFSYWALGAPLIFLALILWMFSSMTIQITSETLQWYFGPGIFKWKRPLDTITAASQERSRWIYGWGIRLTPHGWLYNVSGLDIVTIELKNGKRFSLGTDDPNGLLSAIQRNIADDS